VAREVAYTHHEKWDGSGYPQGLAGDDIPVSGRLMALADIYDALISRRVYKAAIAQDVTVEIIVNERGKQLDPDVVDAFIALQGTFADIAKNITDANYGDTHLKRVN
jgi:putative two-component system response regulator